MDATLSTTDPEADAAAALAARVRESLVPQPPAAHLALPAEGGAAAGYTLSPPHRLRGSAVVLGDDAKAVEAALTLLPFARSLTFVAAEDGAEPAPAIRAAEAALHLRVLRGTPTSMVMDGDRLRAVRIVRDGRTLTLPADHLVVGVPASAGADDAGEAPLLLAFGGPSVGVRGSLWRRVVGAARAVGPAPSIADACRTLHRPEA